MPKYNEERVLKNRQAAQASRDRKKQQFEFLVRENQRLQEQNQALEARLAALESTNQTLLACLTPIHMPSPPMDSLFDFTTPLPAQPVLLSKFPTDPTVIALPRKGTKQQHRESSLNPSFLRLIAFRLRRLKQHSAGRIYSIVNSKESPHKP